MDSNGTTPSRYITLVSRDGHEFVVLREATLVSPTIKSMTNVKSQFTEALAGRCTFEDISGVVLEKVVEYFHYWYKHNEHDDVPDMAIPTELCLEIMMAGDYLGLDKMV